MTATGNGHGDGRFNIYVYSVHRANGTSRDRHSGKCSLHCHGLIGHARAAVPGLCEAPDEATWIWSDLRLGHKPSSGPLQAVEPLGADSSMGLAKSTIRTAARGETLPCDTGACPLPAGRPIIG